MIEKIRKIHAVSDGTYGARRVHAELRLEYGIRVGRNRVQRLMARGGISGVVARKRRRTTARLPGVRVASGLVERWSQFSVLNVFGVVCVVSVQTRSC